MSSESAVQARRARKAYYCMDCDYQRYSRTIQPGDVYLVLTNFRASDAGYAAHAGHPVQFRLCEHCGHRNHRPLIEARKAKR